MDENSFFQDQNISNQLIETFGRKQTNKYGRQDHFVQSEQQQKNMKGVIFYQNDSPLMTFRQKDYPQSKRNNHLLVTQQRGQKQQSSRRQLESIDRINKKINGLIKSISASCEKKINSSENRHQHEAFAKKKAIFEDPIIQRDRQQTEKKKSYLYEKTSIKPHFLQFKEKQRHYEMPSQEQESSHFYEEENFDSLDERIKRISFKIEEHEKKRQKQTSDRYQKSQHQLSYTNLNNRRILKSQRDLREDQSFNNRYVETTTKKQKNTGTGYGNQPHYFMDVNKQNKVDKKQKPITEAKHLSFKKGGYFKQKYQELKMAGKQEWMKLQLNDKQMIQAARLKTNNSQHPDRKDNKKQNVKQKPQIPNRPVKNNQLLSYKTTFMKQIVKQIELDQDFRHAKHMFGGIDNLFDQNNHNQKWSLLQTELRRQGFSLDIRQVKEIFMPRDDQIDPFMSVNHSHQQLIHGVIYAYQTTERHWNQSIYHNWTLWQLKQAKLTSEYLDRDRKGHITVEDLTFYVNTEVDGYFRNRDLLLIFHRLSDNQSHLRKQPNQGIKFKQIMTRFLSL